MIGCAFWDPFSFVTECAVSLIVCPLKMISLLPDKPQGLQPFFENDSGKSEDLKRRRELLRSSLLWL